MAAMIGVAVMVDDEVKAVMEDITDMADADIADMPVRVLLLSASASSIER